MPRTLPALLAAGALLVAGLAVADPPGPRHGPPGPPDPVEAAAKLSEALGLDAATTETIEAILTESMARGKAIADQLRDVGEAVRAERALDAPNDKKVVKLVHQAADLKADLELLRMHTGDEIGALLTAEQKARFDAFRRKRFAELHRGGPRPFGPPDGEGPDDDLGPLFAPEAL